MCSLHYQPYIRAFWSFVSLDCSQLLILPNCTQYYAFYCKPYTRTYLLFIYSDDSSVEYIISNTTLQLLRAIFIISLPIVVKQVNILWWNNVSKLSKRYISDISFLRDGGANCGQMVGGRLYFCSNTCLQLPTVSSNENSIYPRFKTTITDGGGNIDKKIRQMW